MSESEKYVPLNERNPYGKAVDDRDIRQKIAQANWKPIMPPPSHPLDERIAEAERRANERNRKLHLLSLDERQAEIMKDIRRRDFAEADAKAELKAYLATVADRVAKLKELLHEYTDVEDGHGYSQVDKIRNTIAQFETLGARRDVADEWYAEIFSDRESQLDQREFERQARIASLQNELAELKQSRGKSIETQPNDGASDAAEYVSKICGRFGPSRWLVVLSR